MSIERASRRITREFLKALQSDSLTLKDAVKKIGLKDKRTIEILRRQARYLKKQNMISGSGREGYTITPIGRQKLSDMTLRHMEQSEPWDHRWRVVCFDIPEAQRSARDAIRRIIKQLGFVQLQQSLWVHPLPCLDELKRIRGAYGIGERLMLMEVTNLDNEHNLLKHFRKVYPEL